MIPEENISLSADDLLPLISGGSLRRLPSGYWALTIDLAGVLPIDNDRSLSINRELRAGKLLQTGRKALPPYVNAALQKGQRARWAKAKKRA